MGSIAEDFKNYITKAYTLLAYAQSKVAAEENGDQHLDNGHAAVAVVTDAPHMNENPIMENQADERVEEVLDLLETNQPLSIEQQQIIAKKVNEILNLRTRDERHPIILIHTETTTSNVWVAVVQKPNLKVEQEVMINVYSPIHIDNLDAAAKEIIKAEYQNPGTPTSILESLRFEPEVLRPDITDDQFIYSVCYAICEAIGQSHSDFVIGIKRGSTANIRRIVADIIGSGQLPNGNKEQVWLL